MNKSATFGTSQLFYRGFKTRSQKFCFLKMTVFCGGQNACQTQRICTWSETCGLNWWNMKGAHSITRENYPKIKAYYRRCPSLSSVNWSQEEVGQIVSQVIRQQLRGQIYRHGNYQNTRGRWSLQGQPICDFCNWSRHVLATCLQRMRQMQGQTPSSRDPKILNFNPPLQTHSNWEVQIILFAHKISSV